MKKMLVTDYDKTFYINDEDIELNKKYVDKFMSLKNVFVIATGRSYFDFYNKLNIYKFKYDYVILNHGATILDKSNNILSNIIISNEIISKLKKELLLEKSISYFCCSCIDSRVEFEHNNLTKIHVKYNTKEEATKILRIINEKYSKYVVAYYISNNAIEIISNKTNKALAIYKIINIEQIDKDNVYCVGDGYSDIEMIKEFNGYCMYNSRNILFNYCDKKINSVSELLQKLIKSNE